MGRYTKAQFLKYYDFKDEALMVPSIFHRKRKSYENLCTEIPRLIRESGITAQKAFEFYGVSQTLYNLWKRTYLKELNAGKTDTPLIRLFSSCMKGDADLHVKVGRIAMKKIEEGDTEMTKFFMRTRLGYNDKKQVEVSTVEDTNFNINIVDSKKRDD